MKREKSEAHSFYNIIADLPYQTCADLAVLFRPRKTGKHFEQRSRVNWHVVMIVLVVVSTACLVLIQLARGRDRESSREAANVADALRTRPQSSLARDP